MLTSALGLLLACAPKSVAPEPSYASRLDQQIAELQVRAAEVDRDQALDQVTLASLALAHGRHDIAESALRGAVVNMQDFRADGEFQAMVGAEHSKAWKGEPYEKMTAYMTLGTLLFRQGDRGNALAMYKSAVLADTGTVLERYNSDFVPGWVMQALAYQAEGEADNAERAMTQAIDSMWGNHWLERLSEAVHRARPARSDEGGDAARLLLLAGIQAGVAGAPRDPTRAAEGAISTASDLVLRLQTQRRKERRFALAHLSKRDLRRAAEALPAMAQAFKAEVALIAPAEDAPVLPLALKPGDQLPRDSFGAARIQAAEDHLEGLLEHAPNVVLLVEHGKGPAKVRVGRYEEILTIVAREPTLAMPTARLDGTATSLTLLDSMVWQAQSRGGRKVDGFLRGKAIYKDSSLVTGVVLLRAAAIAHHVDESSPVAAILAVAGCVVFVTGAATTPAADIRQWDAVPDSYLLLATHLSPGQHQLGIGGRSWVLHVPEQGQLVALLPQQAPYGGPTVTVP